jgi:DNA/RNA-binding domain of Phe-tRNA-synthetase-like protein
MNMNHKTRIDSGNMLTGIVEACDANLTVTSAELEERLDTLLKNRKGELTGEAETFRLAARDMLRNGSYKPTGRAKPASEYLLRAAAEEDFPRINPAVDINNYISLKYMVPISLWDIDKAGGKPFLFDLGQPGEKYVFNESGQEIDVKDLVCGFLTEKDGNRNPVINPVKDSMRTKTDHQSKHIGYAVYYPVKVGNREHLQQILDEIAGLLGDICNGEIRTGIAVNTEVDR